MNRRTFFAGLLALPGVTVALAKENRHVYGAWCDGSAPLKHWSERMFFVAAEESARFNSLPLHQRIEEIMRLAGQPITEKRP